MAIPWFLGLVLLACAKPRVAMKDVLFFAVDDLRPQIGCYGDTFVKTPHLDALAAKSMLFERAYCQVAVCNPSRASLLTGRRPDTNHVWITEFWRTVTNATTLPQYFKENGYRSIGMGKVFHPGILSHNDDIKYSWSLPYFHGRNKVKAGDLSWHSFQNISDNELMDGQLTENAVKILKEIKQNRTKGDITPFFVAVGFHKPHLPWYTPSKYYDMYPPAEEVPLPQNSYIPKNSPPIAWVTSLELRHHSDMREKGYDSPDCETSVEALSGEKCHVSDADTRVLRRAYHAAQSYTDAQIGRVMAELEDQGFADSTIVVLWADHGWKLGEHDMWSKLSNYEDDSHVPFMIRVPGVTDSGMRTDALVELIDIFPSLTELAGLPVPPLCPEGNKDLLTCVEGSSVAPLLKDPKQKWKKAAFSQFPRPYSGLTQIPRKPPFKADNEEEDVMGYAVRVDTYRFVEWYSFNRTTAKPDFSTIWGTELYDHSMPTKFFNDDNENLAEQENMAEKVKELRKMLQEGWRAAMPPEKQS